MTSHNLPSQTMTFGSITATWDNTNNNVALVGQVDLFGVATANFAGTATYQSSSIYLQVVGIAQVTSPVVAGPLTFEQYPGTTAPGMRLDVAMIRPTQSSTAKYRASKAHTQCPEKPAASNAQCSMPTDRENGIVCSPLPRGILCCSSAMIDPP